MGLFDWLRAGRRSNSPRAGEGPVPLSPAAPVGTAGTDDGGDHAQVKSSMLYPRSRYLGEFTPENLAFDSNLQEFAQRVAYICTLENSGKITPDEAHRQIKALWRQLSASHKELRIDGT